MKGFLQATDSLVINYSELRVGGKCVSLNFDFKWLCHLSYYLDSPCSYNEVAGPMPGEQIPLCCHLSRDDMSKQRIVWPVHVSNKFKVHVESLTFSFFAMMNLIKFSMSPGFCSRTLACGQQKSQTCHRKVTLQ